MLKKIRKKLNRKYISKLKNHFSQNQKRNVVILADHCIEENSVPQDNYCFFSYLMECGQTTYVPYYVINKKCGIYSETVQKYGEHIIAYEPNSWKFKLKILSLAKSVKIICDSYQIFNHIVPGFTLAVKNSPYVYSIFTQHGITYFKDTFVNPTSYGAFMFDKVTVCNDFEKKIFLNRGLYQPENIINNGLFRWDCINPQYNTKTIFVFFTHRQYLKEISNIEESVYFRTITKLVERLLNSSVIKENGYKIKVALHHSVVDKFDYKVINGIEIIKDEEIESVKSEADVLITDYSAMCFELWHQYKPVLFLHIHDIEDCLKYNKPTDLPEPYKGRESNLCNILESVDECLELVEKYTITGFSLSDKEKNIRDPFFYFQSDYRKRFLEYLYTLKDAVKDWYNLPLNQTIYFNKFADIYTNGIDMLNKAGRWTVEKKASLSFTLPDINNNLRIMITCIPNIVGRQTKLPLTIYANGKCVFQTVFTERCDTNISFSIEKELIGVDHSLQLLFHFNHCQMQKKLYPNTEDVRYFGINLITMTAAEENKLASLEEDKLVSLEENSFCDNTFYPENSKTALYRKLYNVMNSNAKEADLYLDTGEDVFSYYAVHDNRIVDIMELSQCSDNRDFAQLAYLMLLRRLPDEGALKNLENQYFFPAELFQHKLINQILTSREFKNLNIQVINNRYSRTNFPSNKKSEKKPRKLKQRLKNKMVWLCSYQPAFLKNFEKKILRALGIKW